MASDYLLEIDGIEGESTDDKHRGWLEIEAFSWGLTQLTALAGGGAGAGKPSFQDIHFTKLVDKSSPKLFLACASGQHIKKATLVVRRAGKELQEYYKVTLEDVLVSSYQSSGASGGPAGVAAAVPIDEFAMNYAKIEFSYRAQKPDGTLEQPVVASWDLRQNRGA